MSPRIKVTRKIVNPPTIKGFKPYGSNTNANSTEKVILLFEEYEALRLCDYDNYNHFKASEIMSVSRPTYTRIYASARQKIAKAFVEGKQIAIEGGKIYFDSNWFRCESCKCYFNNPEREIQNVSCPLCSSQNIIEFKDISGDFVSKYCKDFCICPNCGYIIEYQSGIPCSQEVCPKCNAKLKENIKTHCE